jgi:hypothetical protein
MKLFVAYGKLYLNHNLFCLVDARHIPNDTYRVDISHSDKYKTLTPEIVGACRIYWSKPDTNTDGDLILANMETYTELYNDIRDAINSHEDVTFTIGGIK